MPSGPPHGDNGLQCRSSLDPGSTHQVALCVPVPHPHVASMEAVTRLPPHLPPEEQQESCGQGAQPLQKAPVLREQGQARQKQSAGHREEVSPHREGQAVWGVTQLQTWADTDGLWLSPPERAALSSAAGTNC